MEPIVIYLLLCCLFIMLLGIRICRALVKQYCDNQYAGVLGILLGVICTAGIPIGYWIFDYFKVQSTIDQLCEAHAEVQVFDFPETTVGEFTYQQVLTGDESANDSPIVFQNERYTPIFSDSGQVIRGYQQQTVLFNYAVEMSKKLYIHPATKRVIARHTAVSTHIPVIHRTFGGRKYWFKYLKTCDFGGYANDFQRAFYRQLAERQ